jgi:hypothetical protein
MVSVVQHSRYKYVSHLDHARWFQQGKMFHRTAAYYRDYEDKKAAQVIGDQYECTRLYNPGHFRRMAPDGTPGDWQRLPDDQRMECITRAHEIFVFCLSLSLNDVLRKEFEAVAAVEIFDPAELNARWLKALPDEVKNHVSVEVGDYARHVSRKVTYYTPEELMGPAWAIPDMITTGKLKQFTYQDEYRFAYTKTEAFKFQNCTYQITNRRARPAPKPEEHFDETLNLGDLRDICRIRMF